MSVSVESSLICFGNANRQVVDSRTSQRVTLLERESKEGKGIVITMPQPTTKEGKVSTRPCKDDKGIGLVWPRVKREVNLPSIFPCQVRDVDLPVREHERQ